MFTMMVTEKGKQRIDIDDKRAKLISGQVYIQAASNHKLINVSGLKNKIKIEIPYNGEDNVLCAVRDTLSRKWYTADSCMEASVGYYACCVDHMSTFALVTTKGVE